MGLLLIVEACWRAASMSAASMPSSVNSTVTQRLSFT